MEELWDHRCCHCCSRKHKSQWVLAVCARVTFPIAWRWETQVTVEMPASWNVREGRFYCSNMKCLKTTSLWSFLSYFSLDGSFSHILASAHTHIQCQRWVFEPFLRKATAGSSIPTGVSGVSSLGVCGADDFISTCFCWQQPGASSHIQLDVWCAVHTECSYESGKQWAEQVAVICLKMSPFWELQTADKSCQSVVPHIAKTAKESLQTCLEKKVQTLSQVPKLKDSQELIQQPINQSIQ